MENQSSRGRGTGGRGRGRRTAESPNQNQNFRSHSGQNFNYGPRPGGHVQNPGQNRSFRDAPPPQWAPPRGNAGQYSGQNHNFTGNPVPPRSHAGQHWGQDRNYAPNPAVPRSNTGQGWGSPAQWAPRRENPGQNPSQDGASREAGVSQGERVSNAGRGGHGGGRGKAEHVSHRPNSDPIPPISEPLVQELHQLKISDPSSSLPLANTGIMPIARPDKGGKVAVRSVCLLVNHFRVLFNPNVTILHYDIDIQPEKSPKPNVTSRVSKSDALMVKNQLFSDVLSRFPMSKTAYDGEKNIFSAVELPTGKFTVMISRGEDVRERTYVVTINLVNMLKGSDLHSYFMRKEQSIPRDVLQAMDVIMREHPSRTKITMGRGFYSRSPGRDCDLGEGIVGCRGHLQSLKPTAQGLSLCIDYSVLPFRKPVSVLDFLYEHLDISFDGPLDNYQRREIERALRGVKVTVTHRRSSQKYTVMGLTRQNTNQITFNDANSNREMTLVDYFLEKYNVQIMYNYLPCLDFSKNKRVNYVPMEFCVLVPGQRYPKNDLSFDADKILRNMSLVRPEKRMELICDIVCAADGPCGGEIAQQFHITVSKEMTQVTGRVIDQPNLKLRDTNNRCTMLTPQGNCQWNLLKHKVFDGKEIKRWAILDFSHHSSNRRHRPLDVNRFIPALVERCKNLGIRMERFLFHQRASMDDLSNPVNLKNIIREVYRRETNLQILLCPMAEQHPGYKTLKLICETEVGIVTQCCLSFPANKCQDQYLANLALKINAKIGGSNMELYDPLPCLKEDGHVMFMGADVNHPSGQNALSPSIAAVVATINWPAANRYAARLSAQPRAEKIRNLGEMCSELLEAYARINNVKPKKIIFFRDGVSESQFDMVLNEELIDIKSAIESDGYSPTITLVVAQKRHQTRLFPMNEAGGMRNTGNVAPGTVVDQTIIHPKEFDFYLCSHNGSLGTSKPTHYHVLLDEHKFSSDDLQRIIYNLCYTFPRCTKPISLVPPVYYADLAAYRGRMYHESLSDTRSPASAASSSSSSPPSSTWSVSSLSSFDHINLPKLHGAVENNMIFI